MDIITPALFYLHKIGYTTVNKEILQLIEKKLRLLDNSQKKFIEKMIDIYYRNIISLDSSTI
jgi:hypothetical protein